MCLAHYGTKNSSAGKFPLKSEDVKNRHKINAQAAFSKVIDLHDYDICNKDSSDTDTSSRKEDNKFPEPLTLLFNPESINFPKYEIKAEGELRYQNYKETYSQNDYNNLNEKTKEQLLHQFGCIIELGE